MCNYVLKLKLTCLFTCYLLNYMFIMESNQSLDLVLIDFICNFRNQNLDLVQVDDELEEDIDNDGDYVEDEFEE